MQTCPTILLLVFGLAAGAANWRQTASAEDQPLNTLNSNKSRPDESARNNSSETPTQDKLFRNFEQLLSGSQLVGYFTTQGEEADRPLHADKYTIEKVTKGKADYWVFQARIQYNNQDTKMAIPLEVKWAGDTPVITLDQVLVPGLGTFSARVLIYDDEYAGTWSAGDHGGHMFGRIVKETGEKSSDADNSDDDRPRDAANK